MPNKKTALCTSHFTRTVLKRLVISIVSFFFIAASTLVPFLVRPTPIAAYWTNMPASVVVGQKDFVSNSANQGGSTSQSGLSGPNDAFVVNNKLIVPDQLNNRVLIWNSIPTKNNTPADVVLGQPDFTSNAEDNGGISARSLHRPTSIASDGQKLIIVDRSNNRVLIWNSIPTGNQAPADVVVGQANFTSQSANQGGSVKANTLNLPEKVMVQDGKLYITDSVNNRLLIYNSIPAANNASADIVLGQPDFTSSTADNGGIGANTLDNPQEMASDGNKLFVVDGDNHRVLIWNTLPKTNNAAADVVVGQPDFTGETANQGKSVSARTLNGFYGVGAYNGKLFIADYGNARILIYNSIPTENNAAADVVLGQPDFSSSTVNNGGINARSIYAPLAVTAFDSQRLYIADEGNQRILIFNDITNNPSLGLSSLGGVPITSTEDGNEGRLRFSGEVRIDGGNYNIWKVLASVNGGGYTPITSLTHSVATDSTHDPTSDDPVSSVFFHDFEPWNFGGQGSGNGEKKEWIERQQEMLDTYGYTIKVKGYNNNADAGESLFYFLPFTMVSPTNTAVITTTLSDGTVLEGKQINKELPVISTDPEITFSVNSHQRQELKEHLSHYEVWIKKLKVQSEKLKVEENNTKEENWEKYIEHIPVDYDLVKDNLDNQRKGINQFVTNTSGENILLDPNNGDGRYEDDTVIVTFEKASSEITVSKKRLSLDSQRQSFSESLTPGVYQLRISAIDKHHHTQDSDTVVVKVE